MPGLPDPRSVRVHARRHRGSVGRTPRARCHEAAARLEEGDALESVEYAPQLPNPASCLSSTPNPARAATRLHRGLAQAPRRPADGAARNAGRGRDRAASGVPRSARAAGRDSIATTRPKAVSRIRSCTWACIWRCATRSRPIGPPACARLREPRTTHGLGARRRASHHRMPGRGDVGSAAVAGGRRTRLRYLQQRADSARLARPASCYPAATTAVSRRSSRPIQLPATRHAYDPPGRRHPERRRRASVHLVLPLARLHPGHGRGLRARSEPRGEGCDQADPGEFAHVRARVIARSARTPASSRCSRRSA